MYFNPVYIIMARSKINFAYIGFRATRFDKFRSYTTVPANSLYLTENDVNCINPKNNQDYIQDKHYFYKECDCEDDSECLDTSQCSKTNNIKCKIVRLGGEQKKTYDEIIFSSKCILLS